MSTVKYGETPPHITKPTPGPFTAEPIPQAPKAAEAPTSTLFCAECKHVQKTDLPADIHTRHESERWICTADVTARNPVSGLPVEGQPVVRCVFARKEAGRCGPEGKLFLKAT